MGLLRNDGDIIIDAVLTDIGRQQLARGRPIVSQFALADDEINYGLFDTTNSSGSAYYDVSILQAPIFEPSTLSQASLKSKLFSYPDQNLDFLPVFKLNQSNLLNNNVILENDAIGLNTVVVVANDTAVTSIGQSRISEKKYFIDGRRNTGTQTFTTTPTVSSQILSSVGGLTSRTVRVSQGFDTAATLQPIAPLEEINFSVYVNRLFLNLVDKNYDRLKNPAIIASPFSRTQATDIYKLSINSDPTYFGDVESTTVNNSTVLATSLAALSRNSVGKEIQFSLQVSDFIANNPSYYFNTYGTSQSLMLDGITSLTYLTINTFVRVVGDGYGFAVDVPVTLVYKS